MPSGHAGHSVGTATARCEEGGDDVKSARPLRPGLHTCYNGGYSESVVCKCGLIMKASLSSDWGLQPDPMKLDWLVIAHQPWRGEYVPRPCTHRQASHESRGRLKSVTARDGLGCNRCLGLSRNKVAVPEGAAGTPPFWSTLRARLGGAIEALTPPCSLCLRCLFLFDIVGEARRARPAAQSHSSVG